MDKKELKETIIHKKKVKKNKMNVQEIIEYLFGVNKKIFKGDCYNNTIKNKINDLDKEKNPLSTILLEKNILVNKKREKDDNNPYKKYFNRKKIGYKFKVNLKNYVMNFEEVEFKNELLKGKINIKLPSKSFNYAASGDYEPDDWTHISYVDHYDVEILEIKYDISFVMSDELIKLKIYPLISV